MAISFGKPFIRIASLILNGNWVRLSKGESCALHTCWLCLACIYSRVCTYVCVQCNCGIWIKIRNAWRLVNIQGKPNKFNSICSLYFLGKWIILKIGMDLNYLLFVAVNFLEQNYTKDRMNEFILDNLNNKHFLLYKYHVTVCVHWIYAVIDILQN